MYLLPLGVSSNGPIKSIPTYIVRRVHAISKKFCIGKLVAKRISTMLRIRVTFLTMYVCIGPHASLQGSADLEQLHVKM